MSNSIFNERMFGGVLEVVVITLGIKTRTLHMLGKHSAIELHPVALVQEFFIKSTHYDCHYLIGEKTESSR